MRFIHAADIHLDSPLKNLDRYEGAPVAETRAASRRALENLVKLAIDQEVNFVVLAGDIYDGDWKDYQTGLFFVDQMARLQRAKIPVIGISGNHDAQSRISKSLSQTSIVMLPTKKPVTHRLEDFGVAIHGRGFESAAEPNNVVRDYPAAVKGYFNLGLLHTSLDGDGGEHQRYAPCSIDDLVAHGYDYWALGHIHKRQVLSERPWIVFPGNLQGRHIREAGAKGCYLVEVDGRGQATPTFMPLDVMRWEHCRVDVSAAACAAEALELMTQELQRYQTLHADLPLALRVTFAGRSVAQAEIAGDLENWKQTVRARARESQYGQVWVEKVIDNTLPPLTQQPLDEGPLLLLNQLFQQAQSDPTMLAELQTEYADLMQKLPKELMSEVDSLPLSDSAWLQQTLVSVQAQLFDRLQRGASSA
ncbi:putative metallophosphoesterase YhaO [Anatilimnocola aggregata]|uniref:Putative metallophosphoesterase YhaO n=1 Tax=Anatilimnocola aggregata TaxID=2528021 RepID=A0A517YIE3_9BACT|nr:DNA repair exonuclease [Anatilimnocola aggregata]QDU29986.1 putative metallophosphoesterase YhaO [Anatilimnocola aggregata]